MSFHSPYFLLLILTLPILYWYYFRKKSYASITFSSINNLRKLPPSNLIHLIHLPFIFKSIALLLLIIGLARPQKGIENSKVTTEGIDIILTVDVSSSMLAEDFTLNNKRQNRLEVVKKVVEDFIKKRKNDKIGLTLFAGRGYTQCPLTLDQNILIELLQKAEIGMIEDGTAIGSAIATSTNRLKNSKAKSKVIVLLTDGRNNAGKIAPETAASIAKALNIKIYTIGAGTKGVAPYPVKDFFGNVVYQGIQIDIDDTLLQKIARLTKGEYFRATDTESLKEIYQQIDKMEKTKSEVNVYINYKELFPYFVTIGLLFLIGGIILSNTIFRRIP